jgi:maleate isomerase
MQSDSLERGLDRRRFLHFASVATAGSLIGRSAIAIADPEARWRADGTGMARIGLLVPSFDFNPESEIWAMAPGGVAVFASRMDRGTQSFRTYLADPSHADIAASLLASLKLPVVLYAYSTTSYVMQLADADAFRLRIMERSQADAVVLAASALLDALRALDVHRLAVVHPPWFDNEQNSLGRTYFSARGFDVVACAPITPARRFTEVAAKEVHDWIVGHTPPQAEAVVVAGNGLRAVGAIDALETSLGRPVITANQAMLWKGLHLAGAPSDLKYYGQLFRAKPAGL